MSIIHMETEQVRALAKKMGELAAIYQDLAKSIQLEAEMMSWKGRSRDEFVGEFGYTSRLIQERAELVQELRARLEAEVIQWEEGDAKFGDGVVMGANVLGVSFQPGTIYGPAGYYLGLDGEDAENVYEGLDLLDGLDYKALGRWINRDIVHNLRGGWVGRMDQVGQVLGNPYFQFGVPIVGGVFSFALDDDPNRWRAGGTAAVETGMTIAIGATGVGGAVLAVNAGVQLLGSAYEGSALLTGRALGGEYEQIFIDQAASFDDNFDKIDLDNITHDIAHLVVDGVSDWSQLDDDWSDLVGHVSEFPGGLYSTTLDWYAYQGMTTIASLDKAVSLLPASDEWKSSVHEASVNVVSWLEDLG